MSLRKIINLLTLTTLLLAGCATTKDDPSTWSAQRYYEEAQKAMNAEDYQTAIKHFEDLEVRHPFGPHTEQAQLEIGYAYYKFDEPESAIAAADRFIKLYPRHKNVDYAYYIKGLANFNRGLSSFDLFLGLDPTARDPKPARDAFRNFSDLTQQFPNSRYADDARQRMLHLRNHLAQYELHVADFYLRRQAYLAAANRGKYILETYPQTPAVPQALSIMVQSYRQLQLNDLANDALTVLKLNYPNSSALKSLNDHS